MFLDHDALDAAYDGSWDMPDNSPHLAHVRALAGVQRAVVHRIAAMVREKVEGLRDAHPADAYGMQDADTYGGIVRLLELADDLEAQVDPS